MGEQQKVVPIQVTAIMTKVRLMTQEQREALFEELADAFCLVCAAEVDEEGVCKEGCEDFSHDDDDEDEDEDDGDSEGETTDGEDEA